MMTNTTGFLKHAGKVGMKTSDIDQTLSSKTFDRHRNTNSICSSPGQSEVFLNTIRLNKVELNNNVSSSELTHSAMKMFAELMNPIGCKTKPILI